MLVGDRQFAGRLMIAWCCGQGVDVAVRLHQLRPRDFRRGRRLGRADRAVRWPRLRWLRWMSAEEYAALPAESGVRQARIGTRQRGFQSRSPAVVTTLLDPRAYPAQDLANLYRARWHAELELRSLKVTPGMDVLRCKSPDTVRKGVRAHLLVYNLIRGVMAAAGGGVVPRRLSFAGAVRAVFAVADALRGASAGGRESSRARWRHPTLGYLTPAGFERVRNRTHRQRPSTIRGELQTASESARDQKSASQHSDPPPRREVVPTVGPRIPSRLIRLPLGSCRVRPEQGAAALRAGPALPAGAKRVTDSEG